jgi:hypothetical protein
MTDRKRYEAQKRRADFTRLKGAHGYDNQLQSMRAMFLAHGRAFKRNKVVEPFENIHIYALMCEILDLEPAKNDGDLDKIEHVLR